MEAVHSGSASIIAKLRRLQSSAPAPEAEGCWGSTSTGLSDCNPTSYMRSKCMPEMPTVLVTESLKSSRLCVSFSLLIHHGQYNKLHGEDLGPLCNRLSILRTWIIQSYIDALSSLEIMSILKGIYRKMRLSVIIQYDAPQSCIP